MSGSLRILRPTEVASSERCSSPAVEGGWSALASVIKRRSISHERALAAPKVQRGVVSESEAAKAPLLGPCEQLEQAIKLLRALE